MNRLRLLVVGLLAAVALTVAPSPAAAGSTCYPPTKSRSGSWATYMAWGSGSGSHRVEVYRSGFWYYGPWVSGSGYSTITLYHPTYGTAQCRVR